MRPIARFLAVTYLWILLLPPACIFVGTTSNKLCIAANGDRMPVLINAEKASVWFQDDDGMHNVMGASSRLKILGDIFDFHGSIESIGDQFISLGRWLDGFCIYVWIALMVRRVWAN